jgi:hypothetical protein
LSLGRGEKGKGEEEEGSRGERGGGSGFHFLLLDSHGAMGDSLVVFGRENIALLSVPIN